MIIGPDEIAFNFNFDIIYILSAIISFYLIIEYYFNKKTTYVIQSYLLIVQSIIIIALFGLRGEYVGTDTLNNTNYFTGRVVISNLEKLNDIGLYSVSIFLKNITDDVDVFLTTLAVLYIIPLIISIKIIEVKNPYAFFFCMMSMFFFKSMGINILKQGIAFSFFILAISLFLKYKKTIGYVFFSTAFFFHASIIIPIIVFIASYRVKNINWIYFIYVISTLLSLLNFKFNNVFENIPLVNLLVESRLNNYYENISDYKTGFRFEFWIFNTFFSIIGFLTYKNIMKFNKNVITINYKFLFISYLMLSSFFFLMFSASYSDRFGLMSWVMIPFLLLPYFNSRRSVKFFNILILYAISVIVYIVFKYI